MSDVHAPLPGHLTTGRVVDALGPGVVEERQVALRHPEVAGVAAGGVAWVSLVASAPGIPQDGAVSVAAPATCVLQLDPGTWTVHWFVSDWGDEFTPRSAAAADGPLSLGVRAGRSSKGMHPWVCLERAEGGAVVVSPAWSGNWTVDVTPGPDGPQVRAGLSPWGFTRDLHDGQDLVAPDVAVAWGPDRRSAGAALAADASAHVVPATAWTQHLGMEWNHWWPYEDAEIDHATFLRDAAIAHGLGAEVATLDAGWFGRPDAGTFWERERGDWDSENTARFPTGVAGLADEVRAGGLEFGVWIEAEAVGTEAAVRRDRPEVLARRDDDPPAAPLDPDDPGFLGYVCLGSPAGRDHVAGSVDRLLARSGARWLKWDFNLDPGAGCSRTDHGHGAGDGLYEHYRGLYGVMDGVRAAYPGLLLEACSSGGLRIDLGLLSHVHCAFLSDPDWTEFHLQLLWGACQMLPAAALLHFPESHWRTYHPLQNFDPATASVPTFDAMLRAVMLHRFGLCFSMAALPEPLRQRLAGHLRTWRQEVVPLLQDGGVVRPLTLQPRREGAGHRFPAFELVAGDRRVVVAHRLDGGEGEQVVRLDGLDPDAVHEVRLLGPGGSPDDVPGWGGATSTRVTGRALATDGLRLVAAGEDVSWLLAVAPAEGPA